MKRAFTIIVMLCVAAALNSCENAWVVFPKYPAPYSYQHPKKVTGSEIGINHVTVGVSLGQSRSIFDYESPTAISVHVTCRGVDKKAATGLIRLERVFIEIDGENRYTQRFEDVAVAFGGGEKKVEGVLCSGKNGEIRFAIFELPPQAAYKKGQTLTVNAAVAVSHQGVTKRGEVSSQYLGTTKRGVMRRAYVP